MTKNLPVKKEIKRDKSLLNLKPSDIKHIKLFRLVCMPPFLSNIDAYIEVYRPHLKGKKLKPKTREMFSGIATHLLQRFAKSSSFQDLLELSGLGNQKVVEELHKFLNAQDMSKYGMKTNWWAKNQALEKIMRAKGLIEPQQIEVSLKPPKETMEEINKETEELKDKIKRLEAGERVIEK
jgi:hypothetical protein